MDIRGPAAARGGGADCCGCCDDYLMRQYVPAHALRERNATEYESLPDWVVGERIELPMANRRAGHKPTIEEFLDLADAMGFKQCPRCMYDIRPKYDRGVLIGDPTLALTGPGDQRPRKPGRIMPIGQIVHDMVARCPNCRIDYPGGKYNGKWPPTIRNPSHPVPGVDPFKATGDSKRSDGSTRRGKGHWAKMGA